MDDRTTPTLSELLEEPIVIAMMQRDGVSREAIQQLFNRVRDSLRDQQHRLAA
ncbi:hypothetical protein [Azospirillum thermophilum]|uniref:hypothetical protein n=1 Tax=Azospirillum thermophilum TaxID=2202148 RepID=UPI00143DF075|nr:hypothetical protein [Azospirillum thermophilum]